MLHDQLRETIQAHDIPRGTICKLAAVWPSDLSAYLGGTKDLGAEREMRVAHVVDEIVRVVTACAPLRLDLRDPYFVKTLIDMKDEIDDDVIEAAK